jgi:hypothetical protein
VADSPKWGEGYLLYALELFHNDGPWTHPDDYKKVNAVLRYSQGTRLNGFNLTAMAYHGAWNATDQVAKRAVDSGLIGRFDALDPTDGGEASRYSLSGAWKRTAGNSVTQANAYLVRSKLSLFSNFTYFLDDPVNGDQFAQPDSRVFWGMNASHTWLGNWNGREVENTIGLQVRNDNIFNGLFKTRQRETLSTVRQDHVTEGSLGVYFQNRTQWLEKFRTVAGVRGDFYRAKVESDNPANSGEVRRQTTTSIWGVDSTATTRAGPRSPSPPGTGRTPTCPRIRRRCWCAPREPRSACAARSCRVCRARWPFSCWTLTPSWSSSAMPEPPRRAVPAAASASSSPTTTPPPRG